MIRGNVSDKSMTRRQRVYLPAMVGYFAIQIGLQLQARLNENFSESVWSPNMLAALFVIGALATFGGRPLLSWATYAVPASAGLVYDFLVLVPRDQDGFTTGAAVFGIVWIVVTGLVSWACNVVHKHRLAVR